MRSIGARLAAVAVLAHLAGCTSAPTCSAPFAGDPSQPPTVELVAAVLTVTLTDRTGRTASASQELVPTCEPGPHAALCACLCASGTTKASASSDSPSSNIDRA